MRTVVEATEKRVLQEMEAQAGTAEARLDNLAAAMQQERERRVIHAHSKGAARIPLTCPLISRPPSRP